MQQHRQLVQAKEGGLVTATAEHTHNLTPSHPGLSDPRAPARVHSAKKFSACGLLNQLLHLQQGEADRLHRAV